MPKGDFLAGVAMALAVLGATGAATAIIVRRRLSHLDALERLLGGATIFSAILILVHLVPLMLGVMSRGTVLAAAALAIGLAVLVKPAAAEDSPDDPIELPPDTRAGRIIAAAATGFAATAALADLGRWGGDEELSTEALDVRRRG